MIALDCTFLGTEGAARELMKAVDDLPAPMVDTRAMMSTAELGQITGEPTVPGPGRSRGELLTALDDAALDVLLGEPIAPLMTVQIRHLGGALARPSDSPHGALAEPYAVYMFGVPTSPEVAESITLRQSELAASLPVSGRKPISFLSPSERLSDALSSSSLQRLRRLKDEYDPTLIVHGNFSLLD